MKPHSVDTKPGKKYSATKTFYNYRNNDFQRVNSYLSQGSQLKTTPDDLPLDKETYLKIIKNNQEISGNLNNRKFSQDFSNNGYSRHSSLSGLSPIDILKIKQTSPVTELNSEPPSSGGGFRVNRKESLSSTTKPQFYQPQIGKPVTCSLFQVNSARSQRLPTEQDKPKVNSPRSIFEMSNQEIQNLEKKLIAKNKLNNDRAQALSQLEMKRENKRDISHISDSHTKGIFPNTQLHSPSGNRPLKTPSGYELHLGLIRPTTPEPQKNEIGSRGSIDKTNPSQNVTTIGKKYLNDITLFDEVHQNSDSERNGKSNNLVKTISKRSKNDSTEILHTISPPNINLSQFGLQAGNFGEHPHKPLCATLDKLSPVNRIATIGSGIDGTVHRLIDSPRFRITKPDLSARRKTEPDNILVELKRELPNTLTGAPVSRQDVIVLSNWIDTKIQEINDNVLIKPEEKTVQCDRVYNVCLNELFRQISLDCAERGELLYKLWNGYFKNYSQLLSQAELENKNLKTSHQEENQKQYEWYQKLINKREQDLEACKLELKKVLENKTEEEKAFTELTEKNIKYRQRNIEFKRLISKLKAQVEELKEENNRYAKRLAFKIANTNKGTYVPTFLAHNAGGSKDNNRDASLPANLGVGSRLVTPKHTPNITINAVPDTSKDKQLNTENTNDDNTSSLVSVESSLDFVYEDAETHSKQVFKIDQLNSNTVAYKRGRTIDLDNPPPDLHYFAVDTAEKGIQTNLVLTGTKYDDILDNQKILDELLTENKLKKEVDVLAEDNYFPSLDLSKLIENYDAKETELLKRNFTMFSTKTMIEDKLDGIGKQGTPRADFEGKKTLGDLFGSNKRKNSNQEGGGNTPSNIQSKREEFHQIMKKILESESQENKAPGIKITKSLNRGSSIEEQQTYVDMKKMGSPTVSKY